MELTKEMIEKACKEAFDGKILPTTKLYSYDEAGQIVPIEQTKEFDRLMKEEVKKWKK